MNRPFERETVRTLLSAPPGTPARQKQLAALADQLSAQVKTATGTECPECAGADIVDNGLSGQRAEFHCRSCTHRWGPGTEF